MKTLAAILMISAAAAAGVAVVFFPDEVSQVASEAKKIVRKGANLL